MRTDFDVAESRLNFRHVTGDAPAPRRTFLVVGVLEDELPIHVTLLFVRIAPGRHPRQSNAVLNDVVKLAISQVLSRRGAQIGRLGIKIAADGGCTGRVLSVAASAAIDEDVAGFGQHLRRWLERIFFIFGPSGYSEIADRSSYGPLNGRGLVGGAEAVSNDIEKVGSRD